MLIVGLAWFGTVVGANTGNVLTAAAFAVLGAIGGAALSHELLGVRDRRQSEPGEAPSR